MPDTNLQEILASTGHAEAVVMLPVMTDPPKATYRVTKIVCPSCKGTGISELFASYRGGHNVPCLWCRGAKRLPSDEAAIFASQKYAFAVGGYVAGDHNEEDNRRLIDEAAAIFTLIERTPTWQEATNG